MNGSSWRLENYFFTDQRVTANPRHVTSVNRSSSEISARQKVFDLPGRTDAICIEVEISLNEEKSDNPPYLFSIKSFGILVAGEDAAAEWRNAAAASGLTMLIGATREHLAVLTARGPWGAQLLGPVPLHIVTEGDAVAGE